VIGINLGTAGDRHLVVNPIMQEPISRSGLQYDIRELPESWYPLRSQTHCLFPLTSTKEQSSSIWTVCFPISFGMTVAQEFYCTVQVVHIMQGASSGKRPWLGQYQPGKSAPTEVTQFLPKCRCLWVSKFGFSTNCRPHSRHLWFCFPRRVIPFFITSSEPQVGQIR
jgi:hypothetical protein